MGYVVKHSTSNVNKTRRKGNVAIGNDSDGYAKTSVSGLYAGVPPVEGKHNFVQVHSTGTPNFYCLDDTELINYANSLGAGIIDILGAQNYLNSRTDIVFTDNIITRNVVTDGLVFHVNAKVKSSFLDNKPTTNLIPSNLNSLGTDGSGQSIVGHRQIKSANHVRIKDVNSNTRQTHLVSGLIGGTTYTISIDYKKISGTPTFRFQLQDYNGGSYLRTIKFTNTEEVGIQDIDGWQKASWTFTLGADANGLRIWYQDGADYTTYTHEFELRNPQLEVGSVATEYVAPNTTRSQSTTWYDLSGNGYDITAINGPTFNSNGYFENDTDSYFTGPGGANIPTGNDPYTMVVIARQNGSWGNADGFISIGGFGTNYQSNALRTLNNTVGHFHHYWWYKDVSLANNSAGLALGKWFMVAASYDGTTRRIWVNGISKATDTPTQVHNVTSTTIQLSKTVSSEYQEGDIAEAFIFDKGLSSSEMLQLYHKGDIVTSNLVFSIDPGNLISYENGSTAINSLVGTTASTLINGTQYNEANGGVWEYGSTRNTSTILGNNYSVGPFDLPGWDGYTICVWVKRTDYGTWLSGTTNYDGIWNYYWNHNLSFSGEHTGVNAFTGTGFTSNYYINFDEWYHVVMSHDNTTGKHQITINGKLEYDVTTGNAVYTNGNPKQFYLGNWDQGWSMVGQIGGFQVYDRALTTQEALQNYNAHKSRFTNPKGKVKTSGQWLKVFRQYSGNGAFFSSTNDWEEAKRTNVGNPDADKYSILDEVANYQIDGKYTFKLVYPQSGLTNIWSQTNNPVTDDGTGGVTGYTAISIDMTSNGWGGLERYDAQTSTFLDGTLSPISNWYYAIGSKSWGSATTFPGHSPAVNEVELWIKYK